VALAVLTRAYTAAITQFTNEDFMITLRYVENCAAGHGLVYNLGERVLGTTTPLYALTLALGAKLGISPLLLGKSLNIAADGALCVVVYRWVTDLGWDFAAVPAAFFVAVNPLHARWSVSGMETSLVTVVGMAAWLAYTHRRYLACYALLAILFLLRWDSLMLTGVITAAVIWRERTCPSGTGPAGSRSLAGGEAGLRRLGEARGLGRAVPWRELLVFAAIIAPWVLYATWFYGSPIPVTAHSKMVVYAWRHPGLFPQGHKLLALLFGNPAYIVSTLCGVGGLALWITSVSVFGLRLFNREASVHCLVPPLAWLGVYWLAWLFSKVLLFEWYVVPPLPVWEALVATGAIFAWDGMLNWRPGLSRPIGVAVGCGLALLGIWRTFYLCQANQVVEERVRKPLALALKQQAQPGDTVMLEPIGYIGYYSGLPVLDVIGLVSPQVVPFWKDNSREPLWEISRTYRPEWCVLRPAELERIRAAAPPGDWDRRYQMVSTFDFLPSDRDRERVTFHLFRRLTWARGVEPVIPEGSRRKKRPVR
jgi:hypothetical protein